MPRGEVSRPSNKAIKRLMELGFPAEARMRAKMKQGDREAGATMDKADASIIRARMEEEEARRIREQLDRERKRERKY